MGDISLSINDVAWHTLDGNDAVLSAIGSNKELGLSPEEAAKRLAIYGRNALTPPKKPSFAYKLWLQASADCKSWKYMSNCMTHPEAALKQAVPSSKVTLIRFLRD